MTILLAGAIARRDGHLLLVASRYPNHPQPLWNLPGGRVAPGELLAETVVRELHEETGVRAVVRELAYLSESYDGDRHYLSAAFVVETTARPGLPPAPGPIGDDHVVAVEWVPLPEVGDRIAVAVVRDPLLNYLRGALEARYAGTHQAGISVEWPADSA